MEGSAGAAAAAGTGGEATAVGTPGAAEAISSPPQIGGEGEGIDISGIETPEIIGEQEGEIADPTAEEVAGLYDLSILEGIEGFDPEVLADMGDKLQEFKDMDFTQEQMNFIALELALMHIENQMRDSEPPQITAEGLTTEEKKAWKNIANNLVTSFPEEHEAIRKMMNDTSTYKLIYKIQAAAQGQQAAPQGAMVDARGGQETVQAPQGDPFHSYTEELRGVLGKEDKVKEVKYRWLAKHPELKDRIKNI